MLPPCGFGASFYFSDACFFFTWIFCFCAKKEVTRLLVKKVPPPPTGFAVMLIKGFF